MAALQKGLKALVTGLKIASIFACLYCFICSLEILSTAFKLLAGQAMGDIFNGGWLDNPVVGLMIGILGTVLVQSSSTFTSIIVAAIGAGMHIHIAIPMIMGANIGTSVTNTLVAMTQIGNKKEFELAFSAATVHDMFNWSTVIILFTIECLFKASFLEHMSNSMADNLIGANTTGTKIKILGYITDPVVDSIIEVDKHVLTKWASNQTCDNCRLLKVCEANSTDCDFLFNITELSDQAIGGILLALSLVVLCLSLMIMVKILNSLLQGAMAEVVKKFLNPKFKNRFVAYAFGYWNLLVGAGATIVLQSSSIFTSTLTPMVGIGLVDIETVYPLFLGSNIGTTFTSFLAALTQSSSDQFKETIQGSLVHLFFNIIGILIFFPIPFMRIPIGLCKKLGALTVHYRWFAIAYIVGMFFLLPGIFVGLTFIDANGIAMYTFLGLMTLVIGCVMLLNFMQSRENIKTKLPQVLQTWDFLPEPLRSLEPYDRLLTGCACCRNLTEELPDEILEKGQKSTESIPGASNPAFYQEDHIKA